MLFSTTALTALAGGLLYTTGASPVALTVAFVGMMSALGSVCRFVLTESCITRVQLLWAARRGGWREAPAVMPPTPTLRALEVPTPDLSPVPRLAAERKR